MYDRCLMRTCRDGVIRLWPASRSSAFSKYNIVLVYCSVRVPSWSVAKELATFCTRYIFRGQASATWGLASTLERAIEFSPTYITALPNREEWVLYNFKRQAHLLLNSPPRNEEWLDWQSLIQHHGGPTRMLDFTHSFYVAAFFALERATTDAAIWALDWMRLLGRQDFIDCPPITELNANNIAILEDAKTASLAGSSVVAGVVSVEPIRLSERMAIQKGAFVAPLDLARPYMENLGATFNFDFTVHNDSQYVSDVSLFQDLDYLKAPPAVKFILPVGMRRHALDDLASMNIDASTLFPGLDGFARSLYRRV